MRESGFVFKRKHYYLLAGGVGLVWGLLIGIDQRHCFHPSQPPFLQCIAEDPTDVVLPTVVVTVYVLVFAGVMDLLYRGFRHFERLTLAMMLLGGGLTTWWTLAVGEICTTDAPDVVSCVGFSDWPGLLVPIFVGVLIFGLLGNVLARVLKRRSTHSKSVRVSGRP
jgi:hypothetical protein